MTDENSLVDEEIGNHKSDLTEWVKEVKDLPVVDSQKGVRGRFVRDCETLVNDLDTTEKPSCADLSDFCDRKNSLEIQYTAITQDNQ